MGNQDSVKTYEMLFDNVNHFAAYETRALENKRTQ